MNFLQMLKSYLLAILLVGSLNIVTEGKKVIFYGKPSVLTSQLLITQGRAKACPKGELRDYRNRCRRAIAFTQLTRG